MTDIPTKTKQIGIFALANAADPETTAIGVKNFQQFTGWEVIPYQLTPPGPRRLAGNDATRAKIFNDLLDEPRLDGLVAIRGGYGVTRLLDQIDFQKLRQKDCFLCGYSDLTALLLVAWKNGCRHLVHGPMIQSSWAANPNTTAFQIEANSFLNALNQKISSPPPLYPSPFTLYPSPCTLHARALIPMNLTLLDALLGTEYLPDLSGTLLALEDIAAPAHDIDRKLNHLRQAGILQRLAGLVFGSFTDAADEEFLPEIRREYATFVRGPVIENFPFGHEHPSIALPFGEPVTLEISKNQTIKLALRKN